MVMKGKTSTELAEELFVRPLTVGTYSRNLMQKFELKKVAAFVKLALELKFI
jgi:DNA-binding CsgD family transcriptional regulator